MLKTLIVTCLLSFSCSSGSLKQEAAEQPYQSNKRELIGNCIISGGFNWRNSFVEPVSYENEDFTIYFDSQQLSDYRNCLCSFGYLRYLSFEYQEGFNYVITFGYYSNPSTIETHSEGLYMDEEISDVSSSWRSLIFYNLGSAYITDNQYKIFSAYFTSEDNTYVTSYSGYYTFTDYPLANYTDYFEIFGYMTFRYNNFYYLHNISTEVKTCQTIIFDTESGNYILKETFVNGLQNIYCNGLKMTRYSYNYLSTIGVFNYVRDSSADAYSFQDLIFSVWDGPLYFVHMLLNFELFGVELYIAFASLLTVLLAIVCLRKFL